MRDVWINFQIAKHFEKITVCVLAEAEETHEKPYILFSYIFQLMWKESKNNITNNQREKV